MDKATTGYPQYNGLLYIEGCRGYNHHKPMLETVYMDTKQPQKTWQLVVFGCSVMPLENKHTSQQFLL